MTDTPPTPDTTDLTPPPGVQALLDEATVEGGPYAAEFTAASVLLRDTRTRTVVKEVAWPGAGQFGTNLLRNILGGQQVADTRASLQLPSP